MKSKLLERAQRIPVGSPRNSAYTEESIAVCLAWLEDGVRLKQVRAVTGGKTSNNAYTFLAQGLRAAFQLGHLKKVKK